MAKIKNLAFYPKFGLKKKISFLASGSENLYNSGFVSFPFDVLHRMLPLKLKFLNESYVALEDNNPKGLISLQSERGNPFKWRITQFYLEQDSYDVGKQLIDFVISKYYAAGVNSFFVSFDDDETNLLKLFAKDCGFKIASCEQIWQEKQHSNLEKQLSFSNFRRFRNSDAKFVAELFNDNLFPHVKVSLSKTKDFFSEGYLRGLRPGTNFNYVLDDDAQKNSIKGYFAITTRDNQNYILDTILNPAYDDYLPDIIEYARIQISKRQKNFALFIKLRKYLYNFKKHEEILTKNNFRCYKNSLILVKDFYRPIKQESLLKTPAIVFNEMSPAAFKLKTNEQDN